MLGGREEKQARDMMQVEADTVTEMAWEERKDDERETVRRRQTSRRGGSKRRW